MAVNVACIGGVPHTTSSGKGFQCGAARAAGHAIRRVAAPVSLPQQGGRFSAAVPAWRGGVRGDAEPDQLSREHLRLARPGRCVRGLVQRDAGDQSQLQGGAVRGCRRPDRRDYFAADDIFRQQGAGAHPALAGVLPEPAQSVRHRAGRVETGLFGSRRLRMHRGAAAGNARRSAQI